MCDVVVRSSTSDNERQRTQKKRAKSTNSSFVVHLMHFVDNTTNDKHERKQIKPQNMRIKR